MPGLKGATPEADQYAPLTGISLLLVRFHWPHKQVFMTIRARRAAASLRRAGLAALLLALAMGQAISAAAQTAGKKPVWHTFSQRAQTTLAGNSPDPQPPFLMRRVKHTASMPLPRTLPLSVTTIRSRPLQRIHQLVHPELYPHFDLYLYVNKAAQGLSAQHMYIFERLPNGDFNLKFRWLTSTGRERQERYFTTTPTGIYKLDAGRFYRHYASRVWDGVPMPFAMFLDFGYASGRVSGIAIHGTNSRRNLGRRASGGCIRLAMENARFLFYLIKTQYGGRVPKFAWNSSRGHTSRAGVVRRDQSGKPVTEWGYRVLLIVDNIGHW